MVSQCVTAIRGRMLRAVKLDTCGNPVTGASSAMVITKGFIEFKLTPQYEDGTEYTKKAADGTLCVNEKDSATLKRWQIDGTLCVMDPDLIVMLTGASGRLLTTSATGTGVAFNASKIIGNTSLELWQDVSGRNACDAAGNPQYVYWALPNVFNAQVQDLTIGNDSVDFKFRGETDAVGPRWGTGTGWTTFWMPTSPGLVAGEHVAYNVTTNAPPTAVCGAQALAG